MRFRVPLVLAAALVVSGTAQSATPRIVQAGGSVYPEQSYILSLPGSRLISASQVRVTENGRPVTNVGLTLVGESQASRVADVVALDASWSMSGKPERAALDAARAFVAQLNSGDEFGLVTFNNAVDVVQPLTANRATIASALAKTPPIRVGTKIYDGLAESLALIQAAHVTAGSIVILTDGSDVGSALTPRTVLSRLAAAHVRVFSVGIPSPSYDRAALQRMASITGGAYVKATSLSRLGPILARVGARLSDEYLLSYHSAAEPGAQVRVAVSVAGFPGVATAIYVSPRPRTTSPAAEPSRSTASRLVRSPVSVIVVAIVFSALLLYALANLTWRREDPLLARVGGFVSIGPEYAPVRSDDRPEVSWLARLRTDWWRRALGDGGRRAWSARLKNSLELAGIDISVTGFLLVLVAGVVVLALLLDLIVGPVAGVIIALIAVPLAARSFAAARLRRKRRAFAEQLPDSLDVLASALRTGHSLVGALTVVADDSPEPSRSEFRRVLGDEQFGMPLEDALRAGAYRMANADLEQVSLVARLQREMGSNAADVLERVIETVRGRTELRRLVRTLTAQGRLARWILTAIPVVLVLALTLISPAYMHPLYHKSLGHILLVVAAALLVLGSFAIGKIVDIDA